MIVVTLKDDGTYAVHAPTSTREAVDVTDTFDCKVMLVHDPETGEYFAGHFICQKVALPEEAAVGD